MANNALNALSDKYVMFSKKTLTQVVRVLFNSRSALRVVLYLYVVLVTCPIRYWPLSPGIDETWRYAINQAYAQGLTPGLEIVFTSGPLGYLTFPENIGQNIERGLLFQSALWIITSAVFGDLFFFAGVSLRNLALFCFFIALSAYLFWFDFLGLDNLTLTAALTLLVVYRIRGSRVRYVAALLLIGILPFIKLTAGIMGITAWAGSLAACIDVRRRLLQELILGLLVTGAVAATLWLCLVGSPIAFSAYLKGNIEVVGGFSAAMSEPGPQVQLFSAFLALIVLFVVAALPMNTPTSGLFYVLFLAGPMYVAFKHGFVRQDLLHVAGFFCYVSLALALMALDVNLRRPNSACALLCFAMLLPLWFFDRKSVRDQLAEATGLDNVKMLAGLLPLNRLKARVDKASLAFPDQDRIEPTIANQIGDQPVASMSVRYSNLAASHLRVVVYPTVQTYLAYTPYLDNLDASWVRQKGPRFLVFDGRQLGTRDSWAEAPALWLEVYRWYDFKFLAKRNLLLERRPTPRFNRLKTVSEFRFRFPGQFVLPRSENAMFWTLKCNQSLSVRLIDALFRPPEVFMFVHQWSGSVRKLRVNPGMLTSPTMGSFLPADLEQFSDVFRSAVSPPNMVDQIRLGGEGLGLRAPACQVDLMTPTS